MTVGTKKQRKQWEKTGVWFECLRVTKAQGSITELFSLFLVINGIYEIHKIKTLVT